MSANIITEIAKAKINLTLHVGRTIADPDDRFYGYHPVDSLVVFADTGDKLHVSESRKARLSITGYFGSSLAVTSDNLISRAINAVEEKTTLPSFDIKLEKNLPVASGIGGGSADAAAMLRLLKPYADLTRSEWHDIAVALGADVLVCYLSQTAHMTGIGESVTPMPDLGKVHGILVNPAIGVSTRDIFRAYDAGSVEETPRPQLSDGSLPEKALNGRNDLQIPAIENEPVIQTVINEIAGQNGCQLARMSGSGATCFGLFKTKNETELAVQNIKRQFKDWWCVPTILGDIE